MLLAMEAAEVAGDHSHIRRLLELVGKKSKTAGGYICETEIKCSMLKRKRNSGRYTWLHAVSFADFDHQIDAEFWL